VLESVTHRHDFSGCKSEPEVDCVGADVDGLELVVVVEKRQNWIRNRILLQPDFKMAITRAPRDQTGPENVGGREGCDLELTP